MPSKLAKKPSHLPFQDVYAVKYALQVTRRSIVDGVREVECRMCRAFGPEETDATVGNKRKLQPEVKRWAGPHFRASSFLRHLNSQHEEHWAIYQTLESEEEKDKYLQVEVKKEKEEAKEEEETPKIKEEVKEKEEETTIMEEGEEEEEEGEKDHLKGEEEVAKLDETDGGQEKFVVALERETREGREKLLAAISEIMANQRKSAEALQAMISSMQTDYVSLRQRELEVREREVKCMEAERRERQEDRKALLDREQAGRREREEERKADHERFLALLNTMHTKCEQ
ncbi:hypothetical protein PF005_g6132 [Phytophthora fragariae]|uniref:Uncharacterized protein n=1 Tax=Phytophthora fragariae TaxID=53985 RepID=A0A6A3M8B2_9STRA|nr:hypothetical protein PF003_g24473 [Phytophthora fragariae]KAE8943233.1 hypothetical protein PF009_g7024 [Phytophthora fragariae]KAE9026827.1 hypothetical protein PF011_g2356 [Phytophthora fragariae]KAE9124996.1 hypothetical protein PF007_g6509 [Phytophthora fragariae]KAE9129158.1 hypothetical protein PF010_g4243 [Phytophthora fragariae]